MACTFPTYSDITGAQIIAVVAPRSSLGSFDADAIDYDKASFGVNSVIGLAVQSFNDWFDDISITITDVSAEDCAKITLALKLYIAGRYLEEDKRLTNTNDDSTYPYQDVKHLYDSACILIKETEANISGVADFCSYGDDLIGESWDVDSNTTCSNKSSETNFTRGLPPAQKTAIHGDLLGLQNDDHPQYLTPTRGNARYYTKAEIDSNFAAVAHVHDDRYYTESESDARFSPVAHTHSNYLESVQAGTGITIDNTNPQNPIINSSSSITVPDPDTALIYNDGGDFGASANLTFEDAVDEEDRSLVMSGVVRASQGVSIGQNSSADPDLGEMLLKWVTFPTTRVIVDFGFGDERGLSFATPTMVYVNANRTVTGLDADTYFYVDTSSGDVDLTFSGYQSSNIKCNVFQYRGGGVTNLLAQNLGFGLFDLFGKTSLALGEGAICTYKEGNGSYGAGTWMTQ